MLNKVFLLASITSEHFYFNFYFNLLPILWEINSHLEYLYFDCSFFRVHQRCSCLEILIQRACPYLENEKDYLELNSQSYMDNSHCIHIPQWYYRLWYHSSI